MLVENLKLVNLKGDQLVASVNFANRKECCEHFGTWYKVDCTHSDVVSWCDKQIKEYEVFIKNLESLREVSRTAMVEGMDIEVLKALVAKLEGNN